MESHFTSQYASDPADGPTLGEMGEKAFVQRLLGHLHSDPRLLTGHGNDASAVQLPFPVSTLALKIDKSAKPVALSAGWADSRSWGRLAVTANCSDVLASGASPLAFMLSISLPAETLASKAEDIVLGSLEECDRRGIIFAGGDTKESSAEQVVGTSVGIFPKGRSALSRTGAKAGDLLVITGPVGGFVGSELLLRSKIGTSNERDQWTRYLAMPAARWGEANFINHHPQPPSAAMDSSDGVFDAILELTSRGNLGLRIDLTKVPFHPFAVRCATELGYPLRNFLLGAGDWNILYAVRPSWKLDASVSEDLVITTIGEFTADRRFIATEGQNVLKFHGPRNEHFRVRLEDGKTFAGMVAKTDWFATLQDRESREGID